MFPRGIYRLGEAGFAGGEFARHIRDECCGDDWLTAVDAHDAAGARISANDLQKSWGVPTSPLWLYEEVSKKGVEGSVETTWRQSHCGVALRLSD